MKITDKIAQGRRVATRLMTEPSRAQLLDKHFLWLSESKLSYCRIPKAANSSVRFALMKALGLKLTSSAEGLKPHNDRYWVHIDPAIAVPLSQQEYVDHRARLGGWSFTFVRNPISRLHSCWNNKVIENDLLSGDFQRMGVRSGMSFDDFVDCVADTSDSECDVHTRSQSDFVMLRGEILPGFVGRVEHLKTDWSHIRYEARIRTGLKLPPMPSRNVRGKTKPDVAEGISKPTLQRIADRYARDFDAFYPGFLNKIL